MSNHKTIKRKVSCPGCGRKHDYRGEHAIYWCEKCSCQFDDDPDEGGDFGARPDSRMERLERQAQRETAKRVRRLGVRR